MAQLLEQIKSSGSIHANQGGLLVSELPEVTGLQVIKQATDLPLKKLHWSKPSVSRTYLIVT